jgi:hypothetical protein
MSASTSTKRRKHDEDDDDNEQTGNDLSEDGLVDDDEFNDSSAEDVRNCFQLFFSTLFCLA